MSRSDSVVLGRVVGDDEGAEVIFGSGRIASFEWTDDRKKSTAKLVLVDTSYTMLDSPALRAGTILQVRFGYTDILSEALVFVVKGIGGPLSQISLELRRRDGLAMENQNRVFRNKTRSQVARQVAEELGFSGSNVFIRADSEKVHETLSQRNETPMEFVARLADQVGYETWIDEQGFHWREPDLGEEPRFELSPEDFEREPVIDSVTAGRPGRVKVAGGAGGSRDAGESTADNESDADRAGLGRKIELVSPETGATTIVVRPAEVADSRVQGTQPETRVARESVMRAAKDGEAEARARGAFRALQREAVKLTVVVRGNPFYRARMIVNLVGVGTRFSGRYRVLRCSHRLGVGQAYLTTLSLASDGTGQTSGRGTVTSDADAACAALSALRTRVEELGGGEDAAIFQGMLKRATRALQDCERRGRAAFPSIGEEMRAIVAAASACIRVGSARADDLAEVRQIVVSDVLPLLDAGAAPEGTESNARLNDKGVPENKLQKVERVDAETGQTVITYEERRP